MASVIEKVHKDFPFCSAFRLRTTSTRVSAVDFIYALRNYIGEMSKSSAMVTTKRLLAKHRKGFDVESVRFRYCKKEGTPTLLPEQLKAFMRIALAGAQMNADKKRELLGEELPMCVYVEAELRAQLLQIFPSLCKKRFGRYTVDFYIPENHLGIECDEFDHTSYPKPREETRTTYLHGRQLELMRFDPYAPDFSVFNLIRKILEKIAEIGPREPVEDTESDIESIPPSTPTSVIDAITNSVADVSIDDYVRVEESGGVGDEVTSASLPDSDFEVVGNHSQIKEILEMQMRLERIKLRQTREQIKLTRVQTKLVREQAGLLRLERWGGAQA